MIHVIVGGFDTPADQVATQDRLLADVARGIAGFQAAITASGEAGRTMLVTTSEFGRRIAENGSGAPTTARPACTSSSAQRSARPAPTACSATSTRRRPDGGELRPVVDPRSLYATALDWLGADCAAGVTDEVLGGTFERLPFVSSAAS